MRISIQFPIASKDLGRLEELDRNRGEGVRRRTTFVYNLIMMNEDLSQLHEEANQPRNIYRRRRNERVRVSE